MRIRVIFIVLVNLSISLQVFSQTETGEIKGFFRSNGKPAEFISVFLDGTSYGALTDSTGFFSIKNIIPGEYTLKVSTAGYEPYQKKIEVIDGSAVTIKGNLIETTVEMDEVVVSGTMKEVSRSESPIPVEVYTPAYFKKNPTPNLFESLQMVNGVQPQLNCNVCNTGDIHINGMEGPYTMITIDGMPIVSSLSTVYGLSGIPNSLIQRMEVVKGPASTLYGSEAVGGLINIITKNPSTAPRFSLDAFGTSHQEYNIDLSMKSTMGKAHSLLGVNYFNFNNKRDINNDNFTDITLQNRISVFNKWSFDRKKERLASIAGRYVYEDRWGGEMQYQPEHRGGDSIYAESIYTRRYELIGMYQLPFNKEKVNLQFSYNNHHQNSVYGEVVYIARQSVAFTQLLWDKKLGKRHDLLVGTPFRYTYYDDNTPATYKEDSTGNNPQNIFLPGVFVQDEIKLNDKLTTLPGLRYDYNTDHGNIFSPRLSFKYALNQDNILRLSGGNGYRVVNLFTEDHAALTGSRKVVIAEELKPERSWNINLNYQRLKTYKHGFAGIDGSLFYTYFTNKIIGDFLTDPDKIIYENLDGYAVSRGLTLNTEFNFTIPLKILIGTTFMDVYSVEKDSLNKNIKIEQLHAPGFSGTFAITYKISKLRLSIDYTGRVTGPMDLPVVENDFRPDKSPWFSLQNIQVTKFLKNNIEIYGGIKNILNFIPKDPLLRPFDPFNKNIAIDNPNNYTFDTTYNYAPIQGIRGFLGIRWLLN